MKANFASLCAALVLLSTALGCSYRAVLEVRGAIVDYLPGQEFVYYAYRGEKYSYNHITGVSDQGIFKASFSGMNGFPIDSVNVFKVISGKELAVNKYKVLQNESGLFLIDEDEMEFVINKISLFKWEIDNLVIRESTRFPRPEFE